MNYNIGWASYSSYADYFKQLTPIVETVQKNDKTFYRSEKTTHRCTNDNMALSIKGLSNSTSTLNQGVIDLLEYLGFYADAHWTQYLGSTVVTDSIFGIKYIYSNIENESNKESIAQNEFMDMYYQLVESDEFYYAYQNPYSLGIAFGADEAIKSLETTLQYDYSVSEGLKNPFEVQNILLNTLLGNSEEDFIDFFNGIALKKNTNITGTSGTVGAGIEYSASATDIENDFVEFKFKVENNGPLYLFIPSGYERGFTLYVNGEHYVTNHDYSRIISLGYRESGEDMVLKFRLDENKLYFFKETDYLYTLDMDAFTKAFEELSKTTLQTSEKSNDAHIIGTMTTYENNKTIMTTIPYDKGWKVFVDGKRVDTYSVYGNVLMAFDIENAGEHSIEMRYMPDLYVVTGIISFVSLAIFIAWITIDCKKKRIPAAINETDVEATEENVAVDELEDTEENTQGEY
jgi:uncharacterized membrane protein YfhO